MVSPPRMAKDVKRLMQLRLLVGSLKPILSG
jgi:hypothetical protein